MDYNFLRDLSYNSLLELASEDGINASGRGEVYNCIFGRDTSITVLKILKVLSSKTVGEVGEIREVRGRLLEMCRKSLLSLVKLQGNTLNIESGEEPGKFIHEYRKEKYDHLVKREHPWFVYPDGILRNYDSIDSTPLGLIALYKFWELSRDKNFLYKVLSGVEKGLGWVVLHGDLDKDELIEYKFHESRKHGGLVVQSWTDSHESLRDENGIFPSYPIAPVEVQGYAWLSLKLWADFYSGHRNKRSKQISKKLNEHALKLKEKFNEKFVFKEGGLNFAAQALDGNKNQIKTVTGNPLLLLWASKPYVIASAASKKLVPLGGEAKQSGSMLEIAAGFSNPRNDGKKFECILEERFVKDLVKRSFMEDLFDEDGGIRTMSTKSKTFNPNCDSYHNGSFWPKLNGLAHEGLVNFGFTKEADKLKSASLKPIMHFQSPIELYIKDVDGNYHEYLSKTGQMSCKNQAWSAASILDLLTA